MYGSARYRPALNSIEKLATANPGAAARTYRGRFAPTPSGPLHLGSLLTALAGFLQAKQAGGVWLLRIDDLDPQRCRREHADTILRQLEAHGLHWDEAVRWQSAEVDAYEAALGQLRERALLYHCRCTRARLAAESHAGPDGPVYAGTCRDRHETTGALRLRVGTGLVRLVDPWQAAVERDLQRDVGDFVLRRADGTIGYQLACVVDEDAQAISEVVRGYDLIGSSLRQCHLQRLLGLATPEYRHLPVLLDAQGQKLSKQNHAAPVDAVRASANLQHCLLLLGQDPPAELGRSAVPELLDWAIAHWRPMAIPHRQSLPAPV